MFTLIRLQKSLKNPRAAIGVLLALLRGRRILLFCRLRRIRFTAGRNLRVYGKIVFSGPGSVKFGDNVVIERVVTPWTYSPAARIEVGDDSFLNGTRFGCRQSIVVGRRSILSDASISDTDFHSTHVDRYSPDAPVRTLPVRIEENVWISAAVGILPGTHIGQNSVVGYGAVCAGAYPANSIIVGNPARVARRVPGT